MLKCKKILVAIVTMVEIMATAGCADNSIVSEEAKVTHEEYNRKIHERTQVMVGDISPEFEIILKEDGYEVTTYGGLEETMEIDELLVEEGQQVQAGDVLIRFKQDDEESDKKRIEYVNRMEEDQLLIDHLNRLAVIDPKSNYYTDALMMQNDIDLMRVKIEEIDRKKERLTYTATVDGTVSFMSKDLFNGYAPASEALIRTVRGSDSFVAVTEESYNFKVGDEYTANAGVASVTMVIEEVIESGSQKTILFRPKSNDVNIGDYDQYRVNIVKDVMSDVVYVKSAALKEVGDKTYAYIIDDNGFLVAREVKVKCVTGEDSIIEEGLIGGEWVALN